MNRYQKLRYIRGAYERLMHEMEQRGIRIGSVEGGGFWTQTRFEHAIPFLEVALMNGWIPKSGPIVDAGSGDGRMSALFEVYGLVPALNIELDRKLVEVSHDVIEDLRRQGIVNGSIHNVHGDFTTPEPYEIAGFPFPTVRTFYMGINSSPLERLAEKIARESPEGTKLIVHGMFDESYGPKVPRRLGLEHKVRTPDMVADFYVYST